MSRTRVMHTTITSTRELLLEVARQLFAKVGFTNTTMNDIAKAAKRGRRTLYVYFKSKEDVYYAVVEQEMYKLLDALELVANSAEPPQNKLIDSNRIEHQNLSACKKCHINKEDLFNPPSMNNNSSLMNLLKNK